VSLATNLPSRFTSIAPPRLASLVMERPQAWRFEGEAEWPPLGVDGGSVEPIFPPCASLHRALALRPTQGERLRVRLESPPAPHGRYRIETAWVTPASGHTRGGVTLMGISWEVALDATPGTCQRSVGPALEIGQAHDYIEFSAGSEQALDYVELIPEPRM
jgi:hypothetical protein